MNDKESFLRQIIAAPDDLILKSVYADWLQQNGETEFEQAHGEFIWQTLQPRKPSEFPFVPEWLVRSLFVEGAKIDTINQWGDTSSCHNTNAALFGHYVHLRVVAGREGEITIDFDFHFHNGLVTEFSGFLLNMNLREANALNDWLVSNHPISKVNGFENIVDRNAPDWRADIVEKMRPSDCRQRRGQAQ